jgi:hypothetical protein
MSTRVRIAVAVWFVAVLLAIPAGVLSFWFLVPNVSGHGEVSVLPFLILPLIPPLIAASATMLMSGYASRTSGNAIFAGPTVFGCFAGVAAAAILGADRSPAVAFTGLGILAVAGAVAGTFIQIAAPPWLVGIAVGIMILLAAFLAS